MQFGRLALLVKILQGMGRSTKIDYAVRAYLAIQMQRTNITVYLGKGANQVKRFQEMEHQQATVNVKVVVPGLTLVPMINNSVTIGPLANLGILRRPRDHPQVIVNAQWKY